MNTQTADQVGMGLSVLCAVHCLLMPFLVILFPVLSFAEDSQAVHWTLAVAILPVTLIAFWRGYRRHLRQAILLSGFLGLSLLVVSLLLTDPSSHTPWSTGLTLIGSLVLIATHWRNIQLCRCQSCQTSKSATTAR